ncbi:MAG: hypothetical protein IKC32_06920 [Clostridia bacterium]|nr:hypothetical protein [Clostridia bacterium]
MSVWSWIKCYLGLGSEAEDLREEGSAPSQSRPHRGVTNTRANTSAPSRSNSSGGGTRFGQRNSSSSTGGRRERFIVKLDDGAELEFIKLGTCSYNGKTLVVGKPPVKIEDMDDDRLVFEYKNTRFGGEKYVLSDDGGAVVYALDRIRG